MIKSSKPLVTNLAKSALRRINTLDAERSSSQAGYEASLQQVETLRGLSCIQLLQSVWHNRELFCRSSCVSAISLEPYSWPRVMAWSVHPTHFARLLPLTGWVVYCDGLLPARRHHGSVSKANNTPLSNHLLHTTIEYSSSIRKKRLLQNTQLLYQERLSYSAYACINDKSTLSNHEYQNVQKTNINLKEECGLNFTRTHPLSYSISWRQVLCTCGKFSLYSQKLSHVLRETHRQERLIIWQIMSLSC